MSIKFYKYRLSGTNLFSSGGSSPKWIDESKTSKLGKRWNKIGHLKAHLTMMTYIRNRNYMPFNAGYNNEYYKKKRQEIHEYLDKGEIVEYSMDSTIHNEVVISQD